MKKLRWQMSLSTLLLLVTVMVLAVSHYLTSRKLSETRNELVDYRYQYGHLIVDDPSRPHLLRYANQENPWKWHVNFPEGKSYKMMCGVGEVPTSGVPSVSQLKHVQETWVYGTGENRTMFVSLREWDSDSLKFSIGCDGSQTANQIIPKSDVYSQSVFNSFSVGHRKTYTAAADEPFVMFYQTERKASPAGGSANGVVVWGVPVK